MANLQELIGPIDQNALVDLREPLQSLQGNILQGHGRDHSVHIFLCFKTDKKPDVKRDITRWIKGLAKRITSAQRQLDETEQYRQRKIPGQLFMSFFLSASGYKYLFSG